MEAEDDDLTEAWGAIDNAVAYLHRPLGGETFLYVVTQKSDHWTYERRELNAGMLILNGEKGRVATGEEAAEWVYDDWPRLRNHLRWAKYFANNSPPGYAHSVVQREHPRF